VRTLPHTTTPAPNPPPPTHPQVSSVQFSADGMRIVGSDKAGERFEISPPPSDSSILDILAQNNIDVTVLSE
jgi:hypothetical protein